MISLPNRVIGVFGRALLTQRKNACEFVTSPIKFKPSMLMNIVFLRASSKPKRL